MNEQQEKALLSVENLTNFQKSIGYDKIQQGYVSPVALLGLFGESGEVLEEATLCEVSGEGSKMPLKIRSVAIETASLVDTLKKQIRDSKEEDPDKKVISIVINRDNFDKELADTFYYLNILAMNRGLTIYDLAEMSYQKVLKRSEKNKTL